MTTKPFIIAVSGSRSLDNPQRVAEILDSEAIHYMAHGFDLQFRLGDARGVDFHALGWARSRGLRRRIVFADRKGWDFWLKAGQMTVSAGDPAGDPAESAVLASDWDRDGLKAGPIRNHLMIAGGSRDVDDRPIAPAMRKADLLIAVWDGQSPGTRNAMATARNNGVFVHHSGAGMG